MATLEFKPPQQRTESEPDLNLLMPKSFEPSLWDSLRQNFKDTFFPEKLPPLVLTSKPVPVRDIWGFYNYRKSSATLSMLAHIVGLAGILALSYYFGKPVIQAAKRQVVEIVAPTEVPTMKPAKTQVGGGGGGGDRDKFQAPKGKIPKQSMEQITPPAIVVRNDHPKLAVTPTVVVPPQVRLA